MPPGWVHNRVRMRMMPATAAIAVSAIAGGAIAPWHCLAGAATGVLAGAVIDPDLDQISITAAEGRALKWIGPLAIPWLAFWGFYAVIFPHRSFLSHYPFASTAIRIAVFAAAHAWAIMHFYGEWPPASFYAFWLGVLAGLSQQDLVHTTADRACTIYLGHLKREKRPR